MFRDLTVIRAELDAARARILELADMDGDLTDDLAAEWTEVNARYDALKEEERRTAEYVARVEEVRSAIVDTHPAASERSFQALVRDDRDPFDLSEFRAFGRSIEDVRDDLHERAQRALDADRVLDGDEKTEVLRKLRRYDSDGKLAQRLLLTGSPAYVRAFGKLAGNRAWALTAEEQRAVELANSYMRAMGLTDAAGGYMIPFTLDPTIILTSDGSANPFRQIARVQPIVTDTWNGVSSAGVTASWDAEGSEVSDDAPTLAQPSITVHKAAAFVPISIEAFDDIPNIANEVRMLIQEAKDDLEATAFATGSGSGQPYGIVTALTGTGSVVTSATTDTFAIADVYNVLEATGPRFRNRPTCAWVSNLNILNDIRQFGTSNNYHGFTVDLTERGVPAILGRPWYEASAMDGTINANVDNYVLVFGDWSQYVIVDRIGLQVELIPHLFHTSNNRPSGQRGWYAYWRVGADSVNDAAFSILNVT